MLVNYVSIGLDEVLSPALRQPSSKPTLNHCQLDSYSTTTFSEILIKLKKFSLRKMQLQISSVAVSTILFWDQWVYSIKISDELGIS